MTQKLHNIQSKVIELVVENDLCIGCGVCISQCPNQALKMTWNSYGFLIPEVKDSCDSNGDCLQVCPFNPFPKDEIKTENEVANIFLSNAKKSHQKIGKFENIYAGYSEEFRLNSSSGGLGTYISTKLLENNIVDYVFSIKPSSESGSFYQYSISSTKSEILSASKTRYFPVTLSTVFSELDKLDGKVAIVGVGCFIKSIRLAQYKNPKLKDKIPFLVGIICGGEKSKFFTEFLASKIDISKEDIRNPEFRKKDFNSTATDYSFSCYNQIDEEKSIKMKSVGDMWGTGLFKANACDFCDDVTTELADISLGDAWLEPFYKDGKGTNVIVTRSILAENLLKEGMNSRELVLEKLPLDVFLASQQGSYNHRHLGLPNRIKIAKKNGQLVPPKRFENEKATIDFVLVQKQRMKVRAQSLEIWKQNPDAKYFEKIMKKPLERLLFLTKIYHKRRNLTHKKNRILEILSQKIFKK